MARDARDRGRAVIAERGTTGPIAAMSGPTTKASLIAALWREAKDGSGACWECKAPAVPGQKRCQKHRESHNRKERERRKRRAT